MPENRYAIHPDHFKTLDTGKIRESFLMTPIFTSDVVTQFYSHYDRLIVGGVKPLSRSVSLWRYGCNQTSRFEIALTERK